MTGVKFPRLRGIQRLNRRLVAVIGAVLIILLVGGVATWRSQQAHSLLPAWAARTTYGFTPYFYVAEVPAGYVVDTANISSARSVLIVPLTKPDNPTIVVTEQPLPPGLDEQKLLRNGNKVEGTASPAVISEVEGRIVGTMIASSEKTLILLNAPGNASKDDIAALLKGLRPL